MRGNRPVQPYGVSGWGDVLQEIVHDASGLVSKLTEEKKPEEKKKDEKGPTPDTKTPTDVAKQQADVFAKPGKARGPEKLPAWAWVAIIYLLLQG